MKIAAVRLYVLEAPEERAGVVLKLTAVPNLRRIQFTHTRVPNGQPVRQNFVEVETDDGITGRCTMFISPDQPGWGAEWEEKRFRSRVVAEY